MSRREMYAWSSLGMSLALLGYYLIAVFGWPSGLEEHSDYISRIFWRVLGIGFVTQLLLDLTKHTSWGRIDKDERDTMIESKGYRNAYYFVMVAVAAIAVNVLLSDIIRQAGGNHVIFDTPYMTFHALVIVLFITEITKSSTQLYYYLKSY